MSTSNIHGTEAFILVSLLTGLLVVSVLTTGTSIFLMIKLNLFPGSAVISFDKTGQVIFNQPVDIERIHLTHNTISGVESISGDVSFETPTSHLSVNDQSIEISSPNGFQIVSPDTGDKIFPVNLSSLALPSSLSSLSVPGGIKNVKRIRSPIDSDLDIKATSVKIRGNQGLQTEGRTVSLSAGSNIVISSLNGSIILDAHEGIYLQGLKRGVTPSPSSEETVLQYKLCICGKSGRLFKLHLKTPDTTCADVRFPESANPCV